MQDAHLLLVDDSPDVRTIVGYLCRRADIRLDACADVASAWEFLQRERPGLILLDIQMPPVTGVELCRLVRAAPEPLRVMPIALFTHWGVPADVLAGLEAGADCVVSKDLLSDPVQWQRRVTEIFRRMAGLGRAGLVTYSHRIIDASIVPPANWVEIINQALHRVLVRRVGAEVTRIITRRALRQAFDTWPAALRADPDTSGTETTIPLEWDKLTRRPEAAFLLAATLVDQLGCLLGAEDGAPFRTALAPLLVGHEDSLSLQ
jgi:DNA-binding response OmpR family regulator